MGFEVKDILYLDNLQEYIDYKLLERRVIILTGDIDLKNMVRVTSMIEFLAPDEKPIRVILNSPGGYVYDGLLLYSTVKAWTSQGVEIVGEVRGLVASMGTVILQAFSHRRASKYSRFQIHEVTSEGLAGGPTEQEEQLLELKKVNELIAGILAERTGRSLEEINRIWSKRDVWFSADEAKEFGLVDEVFK